MKSKLHSAGRTVENVVGLPLFDWADEREAEAKRLRVEKQKRADDGDDHHEDRRE